MNTWASIFALWESSQSPLPWNWECGRDLTKNSLLTQFPKSFLWVSSVYSIVLPWTDSLQVPSSSWGVCTHTHLNFFSLERKGALSAVEEKGSSWDEVVQSYHPSQALFESQRAADPMLIFFYLLQPFRHMLFTATLGFPTHSPHAYVSLHRELWESFNAYHLPFDNTGQ